MKIGDYLKECPKCKGRWFKIEEQFALQKDSCAVMNTRLRFICAECGTPVTNFKKDGDK
jgi:DNA-directed RNA polymerase subunit RPC12/RpoP